MPNGGLQIDVSSLLLRVAENEYDQADLLSDATGRTINIEQIRKWRARNSIPSHAFVGVLVALQGSKDFIKFDIRKFSQNQNKPL